LKADGRRRKAESLGLVAAVVFAGVLLALSGAPVAHAQALTPATPLSVTVPILMYHHIGEAALEERGAIGARYDISAADFDAQMAYLAGHSYTPVSVEQIADALNDGAPLPERPVAITFDDANQDNFDNAFPVLRKYHLFGTFFIVTRWVGTPDHLTWDEIGVMQRAGMRFGAHSLTHPWLTKLCLADAGREIADSKADLEAHVGVPVRVFAYPYGGASPAVIRLVLEAGFVAALGTSPPRLTHTSAQRFYLTRLGIYCGTTITSFAARLGGVARPPTQPAQHSIVVHHRGSRNE
jgi:peptidoglycan/xylan/chitin deacetylase (PgdA/CDA1 family)